MLVVCVSFSNTSALSVLLNTVIKIRIGRSLLAGLHYKKWKK